MNRVIIQSDFCEGDVTKLDFSSSLGEIEALAKSVYNVVDAALLGDRLFVVARDTGGSPELVERLAKQLGGALDKLDVILVNAIPRTPCGSVDTRSLEAIAPISTRIVGALTGHCQALPTLRRIRTAPALRHIDDVTTPSPLLGELYEAVTLDRLAVGTDVIDRPASYIDGDAVPPTEETIAIVDVLERAGRTKGGIRFLSTTGTKHIAYSQFRDRVVQRSAALRAEGFGPGQSLILCLRDAEDFVVAFWACLHAGVTAIPLRPPRQWSEEDPIARRFRHMFSLLDAPAVLADLPDHDGIRAVLFGADLPSPHLPVAAEGHAFASPAYQWPAAQAAMITFTSGSTGLPKGVPLSAANLVSTPLNLRKSLHLASGDALLSIMALDHAGSLVGFCGAAIWSGADLVVAPLDPVLAEPSLLVEWLARERITHSWAPDFLWQLLAGAAAANEPTDLTRLKALISGGESVRRETFVKLKHALECHGVSDNIFRTAWGMSETTSFMTLSAPWDDGESHAVKGGILDNGRPLGGNAFRIVDAAGNTLPETMTGRLQARGVSVFSGYSKNQELCHTEDGWMTTGDLAEMHDGRTIICGREKEMLIVNGQNIPQVEIEGQIERLEGVLPNHIVAVATRNVLSEREELIVFAVPVDEDLADEERAELIRQIAGTVSGFCGVRPAHVLLVARADIPKTGIGKLQRSLLRKRFERGDFAAEVRANDVLLQGERHVLADVRQPYWESILPTGGEFRLSQRSFVLLGDELGEVAALLCKDGAQVIETQAENLELPTTRDDLTIIDARPLAIRPDDAAALHAAVAGVATLCVELVRQGVSRAELIVVTRQGMTLVDDRATRLPAGDVVFGAISALHAESPGLTTRLVDIDTESRAAVIVPWIRARLPARALAFRQDSWRALRLGPPIGRGDAKHFSSLSAGDVVLITGGLGRIGRHLARRLAVVGGCRVLLAGRRASAQIARDLAEVSEHADGRIAYVQADIRDPAAVVRAFEFAQEKFGQSPAFVLHFAGETGRSPIASIDEATIEAFLGARIDGTANLTRSLDSHGGGTLVTFSSAFAYIGTHDHLARLAGEAALTGMATRLTQAYLNVRQVCLVSAPWLTEEQPQGFSSYLRRQGLHALSPLQGAAGIAIALASTEISAVTTLGIDSGSAAWADFAFAPASGIEEISVESETARSACLAVLDELAPGHVFPIAVVNRPAARTDNAGQLVGIIIEVWQDVLGSDRPFHPDLNFFDAGGTSIAATKVHARLVANGFETVGLIDIFVHPTPNALAAFLDARSNTAPVRGNSLLDEARRRQKRRQVARRDRKPAPRA
ncbi:SDR family NAD(P)-dependent oxidoreductase [Ensifer sp. YR511]|uniref:SDR family NAD(P)-dependent oxidoreductase n=1 Tax=Ensifer sp. YR511 TaxID=1855294 RepID=UPI00087F85B2|nr:SDR family NAD(P)-dependent oxidoreductase [Ensifer sp. YR511]SDN02732.1 Acyl-CoA synthetase (AMP-forming)/AMP-acid ligase II [Ensifer sp. YR511]